MALNKILPVVIRLSLIWFSIHSLLAIFDTFALVASARYTVHTITQVPDTNHILLHMTFFLYLKAAALAIEIVIFMGLWRFADNISKWIIRDLNPEQITPEKYFLIGCKALGIWFLITSCSTLFVGFLMLLARDQTDQLLITIITNLFLFIISCILIFGHKLLRKLT